MSDNNMDVYNGLSHLIDTGDLIEWRTNSVVGAAIRRFTGRKVNHSSLVVRLPYEACERRFVIEAISSGLEFRLLSTIIEHHYGHAWWYRLRSEYDAIRPKIGEWAFNRLSENSGYDYSSLLYQVFGAVSLDMKKYFCSEFVDHAYIEHGILKPAEYGARRPGDFIETGIFRSTEQLV